MAALAHDGALILIALCGALFAIAVWAIARFRNR